MGGSQSAVIHCLKSRCWHSRIPFVTWILSELLQSFLYHLHSVSIYLYLQMFLFFKFRSTITHHELTYIKYLYIQRPCFQIKLHSEVPIGLCVCVCGGVRLCAHVWRRGIKVRASNILPKYLASELCSIFRTLLF